MSKAIKMILPAGPTAPAMARRAVEELEDLPAPVAEDAKLLVSELVTNAVEHGRPDGEEAIELEVETNVEALRVAVSDAGPGFTPDRSRRASCHRGYGLFFVDCLADRWGVARDRSRVWFELDRRPACSNAGARRRAEVEHARSHHP